MLRLTLLCIVLLATACQSWSPPILESDASPEPIVVRHLQFIDELRAATPAQRDQIYQQIETAFEASPSLQLRLHLAWAWATPGHAHSNLWAARKQLYEILERKRLRTDMRQLVAIRLMDIERNLILEQKLTEAEAKMKALTTLEHSMEERDAKVRQDEP